MPVHPLIRCLLHWKPPTLSRSNSLGSFPDEEERLRTSTIWTSIYRYFPSSRSRINFTLENVNEVENAMMLGVAPGSEKWLEANPHLMKALEYPTVDNREMFEEAFLEEFPVTKPEEQKVSLEAETRASPFPVLHTTPPPVL
ncbi:hypothetical protein FQN53_005574 [Emmonsiellopsis sp. PD_33]|nr:hypothetical protein FQN53_005574 [Emmonsiellopsis sp. PD_33]